MAPVSLQIGDDARMESPIENFRIEPNDLIFLYTDGLIENLGSDGKRLRIQGIKKYLSHSHTARENMDLLKRLLEEKFDMDKLADDVTFMLYKHEVAVEDPA
ncbi:MAG: SpoIIE family protein phosphatase [Oligoflexales bacterium]|nr:SpoIIE family protein phosphatase [Oligoflexales bacterium]